MQNQINKFFKRCLLLLYIYIYNFLDIYLFSVDLKNIIYFLFIIFFFNFFYFLKKYFFYYIKIINNFLFEYCPIILKIRNNFFNLPLFLQIILSLFVFIDRFLIFILKLKTRKRNWFYFFRLFCYQNIILAFGLLFIFIHDLYNGFLCVMDKFYIEDEIERLWLQLLLVNFFFIIFFNILYLKYFIIFWIIYTIINLYLDWIMEFIYFFKKNNKIIIEYNINFLEITNLIFDYNNFINSLSISYRLNNIFFFIGLEKEKVLNLNLIYFNKFYEIYIKYFWDNIYIGFSINKLYFNFYYIRANSVEEYIFIVLDTQLLENEDFLFFEEWTERTIDDILKCNKHILFYNEEFYNLLYKTLIILKRCDKLTEEFFRLKKKYGVNTGLEFDLNNEEISKFFKELNKEIERLKIL